MSQNREPIVLDYAARQIGRFETLCNSEPNVNTRRAGLKLWAFVTLLAYLVAAVIIYMPLALFCFWSRSKPEAGTDIAGVVTEWWFWLIVGILLVTQALLLLVPVRAAWDYKIRPRRLIVPLATTCALFVILTAGIIASGLAVVFGDDVVPIAIYAGGPLVILSWFLWWWVFRRYRRATPDQVVVGSQRALLRGSIVELLVAVGCHIWVRQRGDCSAPSFTFAAICAGIAVMLCAFGPGVFYLFVTRARQMRPKSQ